MSSPSRCTWCWPTKGRPLTGWHWVALYTDAGARMCREQQHTRVGTPSWVCSSLPPAPSSHCQAQAEVASGPPAVPQRRCAGQAPPPGLAVQEVHSTRGPSRPLPQASGGAHRQHLFPSQVPGGEAGERLREAGDCSGRVPPPAGLLTGGARGPADRQGSEERGQPRRGPMPTPGSGWPDCHSVGDQGHVLTWTHNLPQHPLARGSRVEVGDIPVPARSL